VIRTVARVVVALLVIAASIGAGVLVLALAGGPSRGVTLLSLAAMTLGFVALRATVRPASRPWPAVRALLVISVLVGLFLCSALPWPPGPAEREPWATLAALIVVSVAAAIVGGRRPRVTVVLCAGLAVYALQGVVRFAAAQPWEPPRPYLGPGEVGSLALFLALAAALLAAFALTMPTLLAWTHDRAPRDHATHTA